MRITQRRFQTFRAGLIAFTIAFTAGLPFGGLSVRAEEPDPSTYWRVEAIRPGMSGVGKTVMVGTKLEEFEAEVLGVMRNVSPGRDMILCRLRGANLDHAGIIQGMSGSPIYVEGKLLGAVAYAWEFAKDPIAGVTPFEQMVEFARSSDRRLAAEREGGRVRAAPTPTTSGWSWSVLDDSHPQAALPTNSAGLGGMKPIGTAVAATGFGPAGLDVLRERLAPFGMAPVAGGGALEEIIREEGDKPLKPGSPMSVALVTGDFDLSGIGTVTHVEGDRVFGFGHPMFGLGDCELPLMSGYIHTVYPRASVSMKMGSPLKVIGVLDTDVSTGVAGRLGAEPDLLPMTVRVKVGTYSEPAIYRVAVAREPNLMPGLVSAVLTNAVDTEGDFDREITATLAARFDLEDHEPIRIEDRLSGSRYSGPLGPASLFSAISGAVRVLAQNPVEPIRVEAIDVDVQLSAGRNAAEIESVHLVRERIPAGQALEAVVRLRPYKAPTETRTIAIPLPETLEPGDYEAVVCDASESLSRRLRSDETLRDPRDPEGVLETVRLQVEQRSDRLYVHVPLPGRGVAIEGQPLPDLPGSVRDLFDDPRLAEAGDVRSEAFASLPTPWTIDGKETVRFTVIDPEDDALEPDAEPCPRADVEQRANGWRAESGG